MPGENQQGQFLLHGATRVLYLWMANGVAVDLLNLLEALLVRMLVAMMLVLVNSMMALALIAANKGKFSILYQNPFTDVISHPKADCTKSPKPRGCFNCGEEG
jgi:hypothetical protein